MGDVAGSAAAAVPETTAKNNKNSNLEILSSPTTSFSENSEDAKRPNIKTSSSSYPKTSRINHSTDLNQDSSKSEPKILQNTANKSAIKLAGEREKNISHYSQENRTEETKKTISNPKNKNNLQ